MHGGCGRTGWGVTVDIGATCIWAAGWGALIGVTSADGWTAIGETSWPEGCTLIGETGTVWVGEIICSM